MDHGPAHDLLMNAAAGLLVGGGALFVALSIRARRTSPADAGAQPAADPPAPASLLTLMAAALAIAAALIHLAAAPTHIDELGVLGWGFVAAAILQASWALGYAISPTRDVAVWGIAGSLAIALAWLFSRTVGLPVGPAAGAPEAIGLPDAVATLFEVLLVALLAARLTGAEPRLTATLARAGSVSLIAAVPAVGLVVVATSLAVTVALAHTHATGQDQDASHAGVSTEAGH